MPSQDLFRVYIARFRVRLVSVAPLVIKTPLDIAPMLEVIEMGHGLARGHLDFIVPDSPTK